MDEWTWSRHGEKDMSAILNVESGTIHPLALIQRVFRALFIRRRKQGKARPKPDADVHYYRGKRRPS